MNQNSFGGRVLLAVVCLACALVPERAEAGTAGREKGKNATYLFHKTVTLTAWTAYNIETLNLSAGADTVLHVQGSNGHFIDGNDDCNTRNSACSGLRSWVHIPPTSSDRVARIIVRAYGAQSGGNATLRITSSSGSPVEFGISFTAGDRRLVPSFREATHFLTVQEQGGSTDTLMLVTSGITSRAIHFDDDSGVGTMSWIHVTEGCSSNCSVIVGAYSPFSEGRTTLVWDEDVHVVDTDADGLSDSLEHAIGTAPLQADTDADHLKDGVEVMGIDDASQLLRFPLYGADPLVKDLFVEADWLECRPNGPSDYTCGPPKDPQRDLWQMPALEALTATNIFSPDVALHIDTGVFNPDPATWFQFNNWGGAVRMTPFTGEKCDWLHSSRAEFFHGARVRYSSGGQGYQPGRCFDSGTNARSFSHELGHNLHLSHGGLQSGSIEMNCKPNYKSIMNYALNYDETVRFSRNEFSSIVLNPGAMDERRGLGTTDPAKLAHLKKGAFRYLVDGATGAVDWNRDGQFNSGLVRAAATWGWGAGGCESSAYQADMGVAEHRSGNALAWMEAHGQARLYWFTRRESDGRLEYRSATTFPENCGFPVAASCRTDWIPDVKTEAVMVPNSVAGKGPPAVASFSSNTLVRHLVVVYKDLEDRLRFQFFNGTWTSADYIEHGSEGITGEVAAVEGLNGSVFVYAVTGEGTNARLKAWVLDRSFTWYPEGDQVWTDGTPIVPKYGVGLTRGYLKQAGVPVEAIVAVIPLVTPEGQIELAWKALHSSAWTRLENDRWQTGKPFTQAPPGIAYVPFNRSEGLTEGRFYLAWNPPSENGERRAALMTQTEGNDLSSSTARRMQWSQTPIFLLNMWQHSKGNMTLLYDLAYDRNLRAVNTFDWDGSRPVTNFFPIADGIFNGELRDQDDYLVIRSNLSCAFTREGCL